MEVACIFCVLKESDLKRHKRMCSWGILVALCSLLKSGILFALEEHST